jgi:uncharacterized protein YebE (UPF0316 family)
MPEVIVIDFAVIYSWVIVPLMIFAARILDVSIGTLRVIFLAKGYKKIAPVLGFFEVVIWLLAITQVMKYLDNYLNIFAYGAGFAAGNYIGMMIDEKLSLGLVMLRIIFKKNPDDFIAVLQENNIGYTLADGEGNSKKVKILFSVLKRSNLRMIYESLSKLNPDAFYTVEDVKTAKQGIFPHNETSFFKSHFGKMRVKGK